MLLLALVAELTRPVAPAAPAVSATTVLDPLELARAQAFAGPLRVAGVTAAVLRAALCGMAGWWALQRMRRAPRVTGWRRVLAAGLAGAGLWLALDLLLAPLIVWAGYLHPREFGLRPQGLEEWLLQQGVVRVPELLAVVAAVAAVAWARGRWPRTWALRCAAGGAVAAVLLVLASPLLLEPFLHRVEPLPDGPTARALAEVAQRAGLPPTRAGVADASRRTTAVNAYVSGLGPMQRIVVYDTLRDDFGDAQVVALAAHEIAHVLHRDLERAALGAAAATVLAVGLIAVVVRRAPAGPLGPHAAVAAVAAVALAAVITTPVSTALSRRAEAAADQRALELTGDPAGAEALMVALARRNVSDVDPPEWSVWWWATHPPTVERVGRARAHAATDDVSQLQAPSEPMSPMSP